MKTKLQTQGINYNLMKNTCLLLLIFFNITFSQKQLKKVKSDLKNVTEIESAKDFIKNNKNLNSKIYTYNEEKHVNTLSKKLFSKSVGETFTNEEESFNAIYKIIAIDSALHYRASYIYLDGKLKSKDEITKIEKEIYSKYKSGVPFNKLAGKYSMARNSLKGGDLGWFEQKNAPKEIIYSLNNHVKDDVYSLNIEEKDKFYIIHKTYQEKKIRLLQVLKISFNKTKKQRLIKAIN